MGIQRGKIIYSGAFGKNLGKLLRERYILRGLERWAIVYMQHQRCRVEWVLGDENWWVNMQIKEVWKIHAV